VYVVVLVLILSEPRGKSRDERVPGLMRGRR